MKAKSAEKQKEFFSKYDPEKERLERFSRYLAYRTDSII